MSAFAPQPTPRVASGQCCCVATAAARLFVQAGAARPGVRADGAAEWPALAPIALPALAEQAGAGNLSREGTDRDRKNEVGRKPRASHPSVPPALRFGAAPQRFRAHASVGATRSLDLSPQYPEHVGENAVTGAGRNPMQSGQGHNRIGEIAWRSAVPPCPGNLFGGGCAPSASLPVTRSPKAAPPADRSYEGRSLSGGPRPPHPAAHSRPSQVRHFARGFSHPGISRRGPLPGHPRGGRGTSQQPTAATSQPSPMARPGFLWGR